MDIEARTEEPGPNQIWTQWTKGKAAFPIRQTWRMQKRKHRMGQTAYHAGQQTKEEKRGTCGCRVC